MLCSGPLLFCLHPSTLLSISPERVPVNIVLSCQHSSGVLVFLRSFFLDGETARVLKKIEHGYFRKALSLSGDQIFPKNTLFFGILQATLTFPFWKKKTSAPKTIAPFPVRTQTLFTVTRSVLRACRPCDCEPGSFFIFSRCRLLTALMRSLRTTKATPIAAWVRYK